MDFDDIEEFDLTPLITHNASFDIDSICSANAPADIAPRDPLPLVQQRPISKRRGKKRSSRACASCRARKVRCNIVAHGAPCSNCRHDEVDCVLPLSRRQRAAKERAEQLQKDFPQCNYIPPKDIDEGDRCDEMAVLQSIEGSHPSNVNEHQTIIPPHGMTISEHPLCEILPAHSASQRNSPILGPTLLSASTQKRTPTWNRQIEAPLATLLPSKSSIPPRVFAPFPSHLRQTDLAYLAARKAFTLPSEAFQVVLLQAYVEYVHPVLPILDLDDFLESVRMGKGRKISLLLFQAVMTAAVQYVSTRVLQAEFEGRKKPEIISRMIEKVKLLYDFDTTTDRLIIIQSLLLLSHTLSHCHSTTHRPTHIQHSHKTAHHYLGLALSLSFSLGLHRNIPLPTSLPLQSPSASSNRPHKFKPTSIITSLQLSALRRKRLERRIWWSLFLQDRLLDVEGQGLRRLKSGDWDVSMLSIEDFNLDAGAARVNDGSAEEEEEEEEEEENRERDIFQAKTFVERLKLSLWSTAPQSQNISDYTNHHKVASPQQITRLRHQLDHSNLTSINNQPHLQLSHPSLSHFNSTSLAPTYAISNTTSNSDQELDADVEIDIDCLTPEDTTSPIFTLDPMTLQKHDIEEKIPNLVEAEWEEKGKREIVGFGVVGEYDDFLEYL